MKVKNVTIEEMEKALSYVNAKYEENIRWNRFDVTGKWINFTLKPIDTKKAGHKRGRAFVGFNEADVFKEGRRICACCWHVHGDFFDALLIVNRDAEIRSLNKVINIAGGNWDDFNIGSQMYPFMASDACDCTEELVTIEMEELIKEVVHW